ncbi:hypothetical protein [Halalkalibaculum sp. DA384]|uniref:hypothetical protein n=1 Tax=Halalkalibaculum sp. DA384 TaxID=3373606 RepID=UPI0037547134
MEMLIEKILPVALLLILFINGCFSSKKAVTVEPTEYQTGEQIESPAKVFLKDSSLVIFNEGFTVSGNFIEGPGTQYWLNYSGDSSQHRIHLDSIATMTTYEEKQTGGTILGSAIMGITGTIMAPLSVYCLSCPKCCFGSCPTVYTTDGNKYELEAELFSYNLSRFFQEVDFDRLTQKPQTDGRFTIRLTNEALETHYINQFKLQAVHHPSNTTAYPTPEGRVALVKDHILPVEVINSDGQDIQAMVRKQDTTWFTGVSSRFDQAENSLSRDWIDLKLQVPETANKVTLVLNVRNTLLSTVLFYDVVLASQGVKALEWTRRLNSDSLYAAFYHAAYSAFSGMDVKIKQKGTNSEAVWKTVSSFGDVGPLAWKQQAIELPVYHDENGTMSVRLEWFPDNFMIDFIGYDIGYNEMGKVETVYPDSVANYSADLNPYVLEHLESTDSDYLVAYPGDANYFYYHIPQKQEFATTLFLQSSGYYTEWLRGNWISHKATDYTFNLFQPEETLEQLKRSWRRDQELLERTFFETKIPLKESKR